MGWIDVAIPGVIGLFLMARPGALIKPSGNPDADAVWTRRLRLSGRALLGVAGLYLLIKLAS